MPDPEGGSLRLTRKAVIATSAAVLAVGVTPALVPDGDAYARGGPICLEKFSVHETEDFTWEGDEPYLKSSRTSGRSSRRGWR